MEFSLLSEADRPFMKEYWARSGRQSQNNTRKLKLSPFKFSVLFHIIKKNVPMDKWKTFRNKEFLFFQTLPVAPVKRWLVRSGPILISGDKSNAIHLYQGISRYTPFCNGDCGAYRWFVPKAAAVHCIHAVVICNIIQEDADFQNIFHR